VLVSSRSVSTFKDVGALGSMPVSSMLYTFSRRTTGAFPNDGKPLNDLVVAIAVMSLPI
ncbi:hypothetical protein LTR94_024650, partial [Friedmanniomyces endolithicus]